jgi:hypothetical protein
LASDDKPLPGTEVLLNLFAGLLEILNDILDLLLAQKKRLGDENGRVAFRLQQFEPERVGHDVQDTSISHNRFYRKCRSDPEKRAIGTGSTPCFAALLASLLFDKLNLIGRGNSAEIIFRVSKLSGVFYQLHAVGQVAFVVVLYGDDYVLVGVVGALLGIGKADAAADVVVQFIRPDVEKASLFGECLENRVLVEIGCSQLVGHADQTP